MESFTVDLDRHGDVLVLRLRGELALGTAPALRDCLVVALSERESPTVVIDAARLTFCDSSGLSVLVSGYGLARAAGGCLVLSSVDGRLSRILRITGLASQFQIYPTAREAIAALG